MENTLYPFISYVVKIMSQNQADWTPVPVGHVHRFNPHMVGVHRLRILTYCELWTARVYKLTIKSIV